MPYRFTLELFRLDKYWFGYLNFVDDWNVCLHFVDNQLKILWLSTFIDKFNLSIDNYRQISSTIDLSTMFWMIDFDWHVTSWYKTQTMHYGLGIKYRLRFKTRTQHYGLRIKNGLGNEQAHTECKLHSLSAFYVHRWCYVTWPMWKMWADQLHWICSPCFTLDSIFYTQSVMLSLPFIPQSVFYTQSTVCSPCFILSSLWRPVN